MFKALLLVFSLLLGGYLSAQTPLLAPDQAPAKSWERSTEWEQIDDLEGRFRISLPGTFEHQIDTITTAVGDQAFHTYFYKVPDIPRAENVIYLLSYVDYPEGSLHHDSTALVDELLLSTQETAGEALKGEVIYATDKPLDRYPGRLWRIDYKDGEASAKTHAFVIGNRYYELKTFSLRASGLSDSAERFFASFEYLDG